VILCRNGSVRIRLTGLAIILALNLAFVSFVAEAQEADTPANRAEAYRIGPEDLGQLPHALPQRGQRITPAFVGADSRAKIEQPALRADG